jgi:glycosyltransferase involved in cell wall biosynthesis
MGHCIIRTQGKRLDLLAETLESVLWQTIKIEPVVVVHGDEAVQANIRADLSGRGFAALVLGAPNTKRRRGHPMNVALDYLRFSAPDEDFFFFLDDDDIIYPFFAERLTTLLELKRADVAVATGSKRVPWEAPEQGHQLLPVSSLVAGNFIPINCYMARVGALRRSGARCREDMDYLEDWDFLLGLLGSGARFHFIGDVLSEFRIFSDGNTRVKRDPKHYRDCADRVMARSRSIAKRLGISTLSRDLAEFDFSIRAEMTPSEIHQLLFASSLFDGKSVS